MSWHVGIDIGGTFTDIVALDFEGSDIRTAKVPSRREDPALAIRDALDAVDVPIDTVSLLIHGTTRVTNAIIEEKLPPVALISTRGFEDTLDIARLKRRQLYRIDSPPRRPPLVPSSRRFGVVERMDHNGVPLTELDESAAEDIVSGIKSSGAESVAVCLLHSYANPDHEKKLSEYLGKHFKYVSLSHEVNPEFREYERTTSTVLNAASMPVATEYLDQLTQQLGLRDRLQLFHSAGGWVTPTEVRKRPLVMALSGPAAGVSASARLAQTIGRPNLLTFDMGGTTTDVCLVLDGEAEVTNERAVGDRPIRQLMVAVNSIGAGGGSIVRLTAGGLLVGPESAGAEPGPACYGAGGTDPTVTDANLVLGYLSADRPLAGTVRLDRKLAEAALQPIADATGKDIYETALGVVRIANANMSRALRRVTVERGIDGRASTLLAFGGAGPLHAAGLAASFGIREIIVPAVSSGFSAYGCVLSDMSYAQQHTMQMPVHAWDMAAFETLLNDLIRTVSAPLLANGAKQERIQTSLIALTRYEGQSDAVPVPFEMPIDLERHKANFMNLHRQIYGYATDEDWVLEAIRVSASVPSQRGFKAYASGNGHENSTGERECYFEGHGLLRTSCYNREAIGSDFNVTGPAIIEDLWSTIVIPPSYSATCDSYGNVIIVESDLA